MFYFNTNKLQSFFFAEYQLHCISKPQVMSGGVHPLHPPPRSVPGAGPKSGRKFIA